MAKARAIVKRRKAVRNIRKIAIELLLANHEKACPTCTKSQTCRLQALAQRMGIEVRHEYTGGRVGRCRLHDQWVIVMDAGYRVRDRAEALAASAESLMVTSPQRRIGGGNGRPNLDVAEARLAARQPQWPAALHPKQLWGEFAGSGGQLLAAALLEASPQVLITAPASAGTQFAALLEEVSGRYGIISD